MKLKVFKLKNGKLEYTGIREVREGDIILEGETSMAETVHLREASTSDFPGLFGAGPTKAELKRAGEALKAEREAKDKAALKASLKRAMPDATEQGLDAAVNKGKPPAETKSLEDSIRRANPNWTDKQVQTFMRGR